MPIRLTCPSCSATLSVKDEYAGRAVKCPKCAGVIPASQPAAPAAPAAASPPPPSKTSPAAPPPAPAAAPEPAPFDDFDEPAKPAKPGGKITGKPTSRAKDAEEDEDEKPRRKGRDEDDDDRDDKGRKGSRSEKDGKDADDDRPAKRRRRDADDDDGPPGRGKKPPGKSNTGMILMIVGGLLLLCCGGGVGVGYYLYTKAKETVEKVKEGLETWNPAVTKSNYDRLNVGTTTRQQAEAMLGKGRAPTADDLSKLFGNDKNLIAVWQGLADKNRAMLWQNGEDYILVQFHPNAENDARLQKKQWKPKNPPGTSDGIPDDTAFLREYPPGKAGGGDDLSGPAVDVSAEELAKAYKDNQGDADGKYKDKVVVVEGKLEAIDPQFDGTIYARLIGVGVGGAGGIQIRCVVNAGDVNKVYNCSRGQTIKFRGKCAGQVAIFVDVMSCKFESSGMDPSVTATAAALLTAYANNEATADEKYKEKPITLTNATVESKTADTVYLVGSGKAKTMLKIKVAIAGDFRKQFENLKPGDRIGKLKGGGGGKFENEVYLNGGWIAP